MRHLKVWLEKREDWWDVCDPTINERGLFCPVSAPPEVGEEVRVEIRFADGPLFLVSGRVMWRRPQLGDPRARAGVGVKVDIADRAKLDYVNAWVRGGMMDKREGRRLPVRLRVTYTARSGRRINFTRDVGDDGLFVWSQELLDVNTPIKVLLSPPGTDYKPIQLQGTVVRLVDTPNARGMGIRLEFSSDAERRMFTQFINRLEKEYLAGTLPDEVVG